MVYVLCTMIHYKESLLIKALTAKLFNNMFYPLEVVYRWRGLQLQVSENYFDFTKWKSTIYFKILLIDFKFCL